jgi:tetratricopeptide (TPR) repeat protein
MLDWVSWTWGLLADHSGSLEGLAVIFLIVSGLFFPVRWWWSRRQPPQRVTLANPEAFTPFIPAVPPTGRMHMDLATFEAMQERALDQAKRQLSAVHGDERKRLEDKIEALNARLRDPEEALAQQQAIIRDLEEKLARRGNEIGGDALASAKDALEAGDFSQARELFETLAARTAPEVTANAEAEFALGRIAEAEIRWHDAYRHYKRATQLAESVDHLSAYARMTWHLALTVEALPLHHRLCDLVKLQHGEHSPEYATRLNNLAAVVRA